MTVGFSSLLVVPWQFGDRICFPVISENLLQSDELLLVGAEGQMS